MNVFTYLMIAIAYTEGLVKHCAQRSVSFKNVRHTYRCRVTAGMLYSIQQLCLMRGMQNYHNSSTSR